MTEATTRPGPHPELDTPQNSAHEEKQAGSATSLGPRRMTALTAPTWRRTLVRVSVLYTAVTVFSSSYGLVIGQTTDTHVHLLLRLGFVIVGIGVFDLYDLMRRRYTHIPKWVLGAAAYTVAVGIIMSGMWLWGAAGGDLHPDAFRDGFLNFSGVGVVVAVAVAAMEKIRRHAQPR